MDSTVTSALTLAAYAIYFMLPAFLANVSALAFGGGTPLDFNHNFTDGRRLLGDGVTWRGTIIGIIIGTLIAIIQGLIYMYYGDIFMILPGWITIQGVIPVNYFDWIFLGLALSVGALMGDAAGSFIKRRINIGRGKPAPLLDQLDFVAGALILASLVVNIPLNLIILIVILSVFLHLAANYIAYLLGLKDVWY
jgi:CDP-2,3-bis-(O-geranylgeranyl)-sn-glycerol synthase